MLVGFEERGGNEAAEIAACLWRIEFGARYRWGEECTPTMAIFVKWFDDILKLQILSFDDSNGCY